MSNSKKMPIANIAIIAVGGIVLGHLLYKAFTGKKAPKLIKLKGGNSSFFDGWNMTDARDFNRRGENVSGYNGIGVADARDMSAAYSQSQPEAPYATRDGQVTGYSYAGGQPLAPFATRSGVVEGYQQVSGSEVANFTGGYANELTDDAESIADQGRFKSELNFIGNDGMRSDIHSSGLNENAVKNEVSEFIGGHQGDIHGGGLPETSMKNELVNFIGGMKGDIHGGGIPESGIQNEVSSFAGSNQDDLGSLGSDAVEVRTGFSGSRQKSRRGYSPAVGGTMLGHIPALHARPNLVSRQSGSTNHPKGGINAFFQVRRA